MTSSTTDASSSTWPAAATCPSTDCAAGGAEGGAADEVAHGVDAVVRCGVELVDVERGTVTDLGAGLARVAGLAVLDVAAVEGLGQDAGGGGLAGAAGAAEEVGVGDL